MIKLKHYIKKIDKQRLIGLVIILIISVIGVELIVSSHAQSPYAAVNASSGVLTAPAQSISDPTSSSGSAVRFGSKLAIHVSNGNLVDGNGKTIRLLGVNSGGTEKGCLQGGNITIGAPLTQVDANAIASWKVNAVRVPLNEDCWLGINGATIYGQTAKDEATIYQTAIENWVNYLNNDGINVIIDLCFTAPGSNQAIGQWPMADEDNSPTVWSDVATAFKSNPAVIFDLFNEPFIGSIHPTAANWSCWLKGCSDTYNGVTYTSAGMQQLVDTVRATGATQPLMIGGLNWAGDPCGISNSGGNGGTCTELANMPKDPDNQLAISFHTYNWTACTTVTCWDTMAQAAKASNLSIITGEFGERDCSASYMNNYDYWADNNNVSYLAWTWQVYSNTSLTSCVSYPGTEYHVNHHLLSNYDGTPSTIIPEGAAYKAHLAAVSPY